MDHQRTEIYAARQAVLEGEDLKERVSIMISKIVDRTWTRDQDPTGFRDWALRTFGVELSDAAAAAATDAEEVDLDPANRRSTVPTSSRRMGP